MPASFPEEDNSIRMQTPGKSPLPILLSDRESGLVKIRSWHNAIIDDLQILGKAKDRESAIQYIYDAGAESLKNNAG
jgi:hypothetical protein